MVRLPLLLLSLPKVRRVPSVCCPGDSFQTSHPKPSDALHCLLDVFMERFVPLLWIPGRSRARQEGMDETQLAGAKHETQACACSPPERCYGSGSGVDPLLRIPQRGAGLVTRWHNASTCKAFSSFPSTTEREKNKNLPLNFETQGPVWYFHQQQKAF